MDNSYQSFPKLTYGLAGYGRTYAIGRGLNVLPHGDVEFSEIE
jgi:hypothetical protein